jgi:hypothetical protein
MIAAVANHASRVGPADACFRDCDGAAWQPLTVARMLRPRRAMCVRRRLLPVIRAEVGQALDRSAAADACLRKQPCCASTSPSSFTNSRTARRCSGLAPDDEASARRPTHQPARRSAAPPHCRVQPEVSRALAATLPVCSEAEAASSLLLLDQGGCLDSTWPAAGSVPEEQCRRLHGERSRVLHTAIAESRLRQDRDK